jgi:hypothetical protein
MSVVGDLRYCSEQKHVREAPRKLEEARKLGLRLGKAG